MDVGIRALTPLLADDYMYFMKYAAFTDHPEWARCCCLHFHWNEDMEADYQEFVRTSGNELYLSFAHRRAEEYVKNGVIQGYLAYSEGRVAGWCNANDKKNYAVLNAKPELWTDGEDQKVKSVVCFLVAPDMRGHGIASQLLARVCGDAAKDGYDYIEAYPPAGNPDMYAAHHGTIPFYEKFGFTVHEAKDNEIVVRKYLDSSMKEEPSCTAKK
ncbi:MAG: GNAT family N-acetyltransferase [Defluviitaleaceae bacterium]|nr:GNAT family N-acetyltransferase [Defluviitaleaceae bacterium]